MRVAICPDFVGFSALLTSIFATMKSAAELLEEEGLRSASQFMIGRGVTIPLVTDHVSAEFQTTDGMEGVAYSACKRRRDIEDGKGKHDL
jgi:methanogenic corrinoid protein MtbC1